MRLSKVFGLGLSGFFLKWFAQSMKSQSTQTRQSQADPASQLTMYSCTLILGIPSKVCFLSLLDCSLDN